MIRKLLVVGYVLFFSLFIASQGYAKDKDREFSGWLYDIQVEGVNVYLKFKNYNATEATPFYRVNLYDMKSCLEFNSDGSIKGVKDYERLMAINKSQNHLISILADYYSGKKVLFFKNTKKASESGFGAGVMVKLSKESEIKLIDFEF